MGRKAELSTEVIAAAASRLFQSRGFANTSLQDVAEAVGIPKGNFYYHFRTKDDIVRAVVEHRLGALDAELAALEKGSRDPGKRLVRFVQAMLTHPDAPFALGCPHGSLGLELAKARPDLLSAARPALERLRAWFAEQFRLAGASAGPDRLAMHLLARVQGLLLMAATFRDESFNRRELRELQKWIASQC
jgi:AcrR family transcriptional regulator